MFRLFEVSKFCNIIVVFYFIARAQWVCNCRSDPLPEGQFHVNDVNSSVNLFAILSHHLMSSGDIDIGIQNSSVDLSESCFGLVLLLLSRVKTSDSKVYALNAQFFRAKNVVQSQ